MNDIPASVEMILPYVRGGGSDQRARLTAKYLARYLDRPVEVVNRPGAVTGHTAIAEATPDGSTIGFVTGEIGMMHWHRGVTDLTPRDYTALAVPFVESSAVIVRNDSPFATLIEFLEHCRLHSVVGSGGPDFSVWKLSLIGLLHAAGISPDCLGWIETYSGEQGLANVLEGNAIVAPITMTDAREFLRNGQARALATMEDKRHDAFPQVPTVLESVGIPWAVAHWRGAVAPRGLSDAHRGIYLNAFRKLEQDADFQAEARANFFTLRWRHGSDFEQYMNEDDAQFGKIIDELGTKAGSASGLY
ncbi:tripartite tricarboxylate transporter substrate binding protein [Paraburkholderia sediminicola]|uniref:Tripartite tricarboxylate transporter substrate binding protein n=1 Tax=Paraburkholderia metrosideri TaxID=580937 RepID=A0ABW9DVV6_9BURK